MKLEDYVRVQSGINQVLTKKLFFVSGAAKSGTTWLQKALDSHTDIACGGEGHFINGITHGLKQVIVSYNQGLIGRANNDVYEGKPYYDQITGNDLNFLASSFAAMMLSRLPNMANSTFVGDKTPANSLYLRELNLLFPNAKYIHIIRDGRDVVVSTYKMALRIKNEATIEEYINYSGPRWVQFNEAALTFQKLHPKLFHAVHYEKLLRDFDGEFGKILNFLGAESSPEIIAACRKASSFEALSGGRKPGQEDEGSFFRKGTSGDWQNHFTEKDMALFNEVTGDMMSRLGYTDQAEAISA